MYLTILDYTNGKVIIDDVPELDDVNEYIEENYPEIDCHFMITETLNLSINQEK